MFKKMMCLIAVASVGSVVANDPFYRINLRSSANSVPPVIATVTGVGAGTAGAQAGKCARTKAEKYTDNKYVQMAAGIVANIATVYGITYVSGQVFDTDEKELNVISLATAAATEGVLCSAACARKASEERIAKQFAAALAQAKK